MKEKIESAKFRELEIGEESKYLSMEEFICVTEYPDGVKIKKLELGYDPNTNERLIKKRLRLDDE